MTSYMYHKVYFTLVKTIYYSLYLNFTYSSKCHGEIVHARRPRCSEDNTGAFVLSTLYLPSGHVVHWAHRWLTESTDLLRIHSIDSIKISCAKHRATNWKRLNEKHRRSVTAAGWGAGRGHWEIQSCHLMRRMSNLLLVFRRSYITNSTVIKPQEKSI